MVVQRLAPWASLLASLLTLVYVTIQEWRQRESGSQSENESESDSEGQTDGDSDDSVVQVVSRLDVFVYTTLAMLFVAALLHYLLLFTPFTFLVVPVWLLAVFVILATGATQAMPGEDFEDKLERADRALQAGSETTARSLAEGEQTGRDVPAEESVSREQDTDE